LAWNSNAGAGPAHASFHGIDHERDGARVVTDAWYLFLERRAAAEILPQISNKLSVGQGHSDPFMA
jgi:hypothetical protein